MFITFTIIDSDTYSSSSLFPHDPQDITFGVFINIVFPVQCSGTSQGSRKVMALGWMLRQGENLDHVNHTQDISPTVNLSDVSH